MMNLTFLCSSEVLQIFISLVYLDLDSNESICTHSVNVYVLGRICESILTG